MKKHTAVEAAAGLKEIARDFLQRVAAGDVDAAYRDHVAPGFKHHNPYFPGDADSLRKAMAENAAKNPGKVLEVQRALQDGDLVAVHARVRHHPQERGSALIHIFRFEGDRIAELWDVGQEVPADSPNRHGMF